MNGAATIEREVEVERPRIFSLGDLYDDYSAEAISNFEARRTGQPLGPTTPLADVNEALGGHFAPGTYIFHAASNAGKSMLALQFAAECGFPAVFVSTEMSAKLNMKRLMAMTTRTPIKALLKGKMDIDAEMGIFATTAAKYPRLAIAEAIGIPVKPSVIRQWAYVNQRLDKHSLLVIDSLHSWAFSVVDTNDASEKQILDTALTYLRQISKDLKIPIIVIAERNRANMERGGMSAASGSARIEYSADVVMELDPEKKTYGGDSPAIPGVSGRMMVLKFSKMRDGERKSIKLWFDPAIMKFSSVLTGAR